MLPRPRPEGLKLRVIRLPLVALLGASILTVAACGDDNNDSKSTKATPVAIGVAPQGKAAVYTVPASVKGGLVTVTFKNADTKNPHAAQLVRVTGGHTVAEGVKATSSNSDKTPSWVRAEGGVGAVPPGGTGKATVNVPAGKYFVTDFGGNGKPPYKAVTVTAGDNGSLPSTDTTGTAQEPSDDKYKWDISGDLKPGANHITFDAKGKNTIHFVGAFRLTQDKSVDEIVKALQSQGPPPSFVDQASFTNTAILDDGKSETTDLTLNKAGTWVLFCPLTDRDGGKSHDQEGLITKVQVK